MPTILRVEYEDWFIPGASTSDTICIADPFCFSCGSNQAGGTSPHSNNELEPECRHDWHNNPECGEEEEEPCDRCDEDISDLPDDPPLWFLQALLDHMTCANPTPPLPDYGPPPSGVYSTCDYVAVIQYVIANGPILGPIGANEDPYQAWLNIVAWWGTIGIDVIIKRCIHGTGVDDGLEAADVMPGIGQLRSLIAEVELPPGSYMVDSDCIDIAVDEECEDCVE